MRHRAVALIAIALLAVTVTLASAQGGGRRGMMNQGGLGLLRMEAVQKELKMTPDQIGKIDAKQQDVRSQMQELMQSSGGNFQDMSQEDREKFTAKMQDIQHKAVADILTSDQMKRFDQLELQRQGPLMGLLRKDVADKLKITDDQHKQLVDLRQHMMENMRSIFQSAGGQPSEDTRKQMQDLQKSSNEKAVALLTDDQKKQWKDMLGDPFEFPAPTFGRRQGA